MEVDEIAMFIVMLNAYLTLQSSDILLRALHVVTPLILVITM